MSVAGAYAIEVENEIDLSTISSGEERAKSIWLRSFCGYPITGGTPDYIIEDVWQAFSKHHKAQCVAITVERKSL